MFLDVEAEIALLEQHRRAVAAQQRVTQAGLEPVPARRQRARDIAAVLVVHAQQAAEAVLLHHRAGPLDAVIAQPLPIDALLPVHAGDAEIRSHPFLLWRGLSPGAHLRRIVLHCAAGFSSWQFGYHMICRPTPELTRSTPLAG